MMQKLNEFFAVSTVLLRTLQAVSSNTITPFTHSFIHSLIHSFIIRIIRARHSPRSTEHHVVCFLPTNSSGNSWQPRLSGGSGAGVEQSDSTDQGRLVAAVFSTADKGPSVSAVVQLTSDYCHRFFFNLICKVSLQLCEALL